MGKIRRAFGIAAVALALQTGCVAPTAPVPAPAPRPTAGGPVVSQRSPDSFAIQNHFVRLQRQLLTQGLLRTDGGGPDSQYDADDLIENFIRIALYDEYVLSGGRLIARQTKSKLRRWSDPVRFGVHFGDSVPLAQREQDKTSVTSFANRLARASGHSIATTNGPANFLVLFLNENDRQSYAAKLRQLAPEISDRDLNAVLTMPRSTLCHVFAWDPEDSGQYTRAVAIIRAEHPDLTRLSCIHEELAQGLGLANDSRDARPSIFNDDEEFGLLTHHDEQLLRILYDSRLTPGIGPDAARPVVEEIVHGMIRPHS